MFAILVVTGAMTASTLFADAASAQLTVGVTVVRSCAVETSPTVHLTCATGASSNLRVTQSVQKPTTRLGSDDVHVVTLNF